MISGVILAGGKSSRMGSNKAELAYRSLSFVDIQVRKLVQVGITDLMISGYAKQIPETRYIPDIFKKKGPLGGIHAALTNAANPSCLVLSVDTPLIPAKLLGNLILAHDCNEAPITLVSHRGNIEPLIGIYDHTLIFLMEHILMQEKTSVRCILDRVSYAIFSYEEDDSIFFNCNTPDDYERLTKLDS